MNIDEKVAEALCLKYGCEAVRSSATGYQCNAMNGCCDKQMTFNLYFIRQSEIEERAQQMHETVRRLKELGVSLPHELMKIKSADPLDARLPDEFTTNHYVCQQTSCPKLKQNRFGTKYCSGEKCGAPELYRQYLSNIQQYMNDQNWLSRTKAELAEENVEFP
jgi:hypothetical protein